jgi:hypothetical protein
MALSITGKKKPVALSGKESAPHATQIRRKGQPVVISAKSKGK